jgi:hypothetical protein
LTCNKSNKSPCRTIGHWFCLTETKYTTNIEVGIDSLGESLRLSENDYSYPADENKVYVEPNVRQTIIKPGSRLRTRLLPTQNDSLLIFVKGKNFNRETGVKVKVSFILLF